MTESREPTKNLVLQMDYNHIRGGEDAWHWTDAGRVLRGKTREDQLDDARTIIKHSYANRFIRGWRVVERTTVITDEVVEELPQA